MLAEGPRGGRSKAQRRMGAALVALLAGAPLTGVLSPLEAQAQSQVVEFDIPSQPIASALVVFARQAGVQLVMSEEPSGGARANAVRGALDRNTALAQLLEGTGYQARFENGAIRLRRTSANSGEPQQQGSADALVQLAQAREGQRVVSDGTDLRDARGREDESEEEIVVVGTSIRGVYPASSPVEVFTAEDIARTGATTTEQFIQKLPQNLGTRTQYAPGSVLFPNRESVNAVDLRGLGVGTTLTLLNGRRMALTSSGQAADISLIPASAIARVEVLTDGASAIYGSDAIGGVINFSLRQDFNGAETRVSYGGVTSGGLRQGSFAQTIGRTWASGSALVSYDYYAASPLTTADRSYSAFSGPGYLTPVDERHGVLATISQALSDTIEVNGDFMYSRRDTKNFVSNVTSPSVASHNNNTSSGDTEQYFANLGIVADFGERLEGSITGTYAQTDVDTLSVTRIPAQGRVDPSVRDTNFAALDLTATLTGALLDLPAGPLRFSVGLGVLEEEYSAASVLNTGSPSLSDLGRTTSYAFGEVLVPFVSAAQAMPFVYRLELSLAARHTSYEDGSEPSLNRDFGSRTSPKVGVLWSPFASLNLRATYGESFRAPTLAELDPSGATNSIRTPFTIAGASATVLFAAGPSLDLESETARSYTLGFDFRPESSGFYASATYFNIDYDNRIASPNIVPARANPAAWPDLVYRPTSGQVLELLSTTTNTSNNAGVSLANLQTASAALAALPNFWVSDSRYRNLSLTTLDGFDVAAGTRFTNSWGDFDLGGRFTFMSDYQEQATPTAPIVTAVDVLLRPADLRGRVHASFSRGGLEASLGANYVDDYRNPIASGVRDVESWTTFDLSSSYEIAGGDSSGRGVRLGLSIQNLVDEAPPFVGSNNDVTLRLPNSAGFDPANANPLGRLVVLSLSTRW